MRGMLLGMLAARLGFGNSKSVYPPTPWPVKPEPPRKRTRAMPFPGPRFTTDHSARQYRRRDLFLSRLLTVNSINATRRQGERRYDAGGNGKYGLSRRERRNLARAYAAKEWRERKAAA